MTVISNTVTSATQVHDFDTDGDMLIVTETGTLISTGSGAVVESQNTPGTAIVHGQIVNANGSGFRMFGDNGVIMIAETGSVSTRRTAVFFDQGAENSTLNNAGSITGEWGVVSYSNALNLNNSGTITGYSADDFYFYETGLYLIDQSDDDVTGVNRIDNSGVITGRDFAIYAGENSGFYSYYASQTHIVNSGTLTGGEQGAMFLGAEHDTLRNTGLVSGKVDMGEDNDEVFNLGTILGGVDLGAGDDLFDGRGGRVEGIVAGGDGSDIYIIDSTDIELVERASDTGVDEVKASVSYQVGTGFEKLTLIGAQDINGYGNTGADTITGNAGANLIVGYDGNDILDGAAGDDMLRGGKGADRLNGGDGDDELRGGGGADLILGGNDEDILFGHGGRDYLHGGNGDDIIVGGDGGDTLQGGLGADVFVYKTAGDSGFANGTNDIILDFNTSTDVIDLSALVPGEFDLNLLGSFSASGPSVRTFQNAALNTVVEVDVDGTGFADMRIILQSAPGFGENNLIL